LALAYYIIFFLKAKVHGREFLPSKIGVRDVPDPNFAPISLQKKKAHQPERAGGGGSKIGAVPRAVARRT